MGKITLTNGERFLALDIEPNSGHVEAFQHTPRELAVLQRAHGSMMQHLRDGHRYDVVRRAWVDADGNIAA